MQDATKRRELFFYLKQFSADVYVLQETHSTKNCEKMWSAEWGSGIFFSHGTSASAGVAVLFNQNRITQVKDLSIDVNGRYICLDMVVNDYQFVLAAIYAPNRNPQPFFETIKHVLVKMNAVEMMLMGDFNLVLDVKLDRTEDREYNAKSVIKLKEIMQQFELQDIWRVKHPNRVEYSWCRKLPQFTGSHIDFVLLNEGLVNTNIECEYLQGFKTDHKGVAITQNLSRYPRGPGYWKFNNILLDDVQYINMMSELLTQIVNEWKTEEANCVDVWETLKIHVLEVTQEYSKSKAKRIKAEFNDLKCKMQMIQTALVSRQNDKVLQEALEEIDLKMQNHIESKTRAAMFRSRAKWASDGERNSKYFFALERCNFYKKTIVRVMKPDGSIVSDPSEILNVQREFYAELYT